ncbi:hypothetical protein CBR_g4375 [Chara braunii]|uniref:tryptophan synthase n=1 Tax=Chara braunii TaxID=69332 RepID=A0A388KHK2_CHABU|nr:hypothetical protein CBR_g4375 [Chara braunii]|eukprot:GBG69540.1 hypothetical protein CBR_g4375 [Chara braunii]
MFCCQKFSAEECRATYAGLIHPLRPREMWASDKVAGDVYGKEVGDGSGVEEEDMHVDGSKILPPIARAGRGRHTKVRPVNAGTATLKDATSEAIRDWVTNVETTHYILGSVCGPHPYPMMVRNFHDCIGKEVRRQALEKWGGKPDVLVACVGGGSNAMGLFNNFVDDKEVRLIGVEAAGFGLDSGKHAATLTLGSQGVLHGAMSYLLQDEEGQIIEPHSISAGLDYPGVGPEHSFLKDIGRAEYASVTDAEALEAFKLVSRLEGIIPALETSHALAHLEKLCPTLPDGTKVVVNFSGRGDKDVQTVMKILGSDLSS